MKGSQKVIDILNRQLTAELSAADQYNTHAEMYLDWGLHALYERMHHEKNEELDHAKRLIERILFLEGVPDTASRTPINVGQTVPEMMKNDLDHEYMVIQYLKESIKLSEAEGDYQTRNVLTQLLDDSEEDHAHWLEQQIRLIDMMGLPNYIQFRAVGEPTPHG
ncbi:bacterioferritin [uncultured Thalassospira sp.]|jgi:bacterioferritin|uniref:bacterioferritin n=1 Tax=uncultured Thalassospira sp. TaxID=404382 RepID=UPI0030DA60D0|tara:strand:- start:10167 stop:10658 length:492 start_codon:yes stop_codon:yes gene_type:complete